MPTLSNEPVNNQWIDELVEGLYRLWTPSDGGTGAFITCDQEIKQAILSKLESIEQEARIDELSDLHKWVSLVDDDIAFNIENRIKSLEGKG